MLPSVEFKLNGGDVAKRYEWVIDGKTTTNKAFITKGGFVLGSAIVF